MIELKVLRETHNIDFMQFDVEFGFWWIELRPRKLTGFNFNFNASMWIKPQM